MERQRRWEFKKEIAIEVLRILGDLEGEYTEGRGA